MVFKLFVVSLNIFFGVHIQYLKVCQPIEVDKILQLPTNK